SRRAGPTGASRPAVRGGGGAAGGAGGAAPAGRAGGLGARGGGGARPARAGRGQRGGGGGTGAAAGGGERRGPVAGGRELSRRTSLARARQNHPSRSRSSAPPSPADRAFQAARLGR